MKKTMHWLQVKTAYLFQQSEKIVVATKENMQTHFNVIPTFVNKGTNFATNKRPWLIYIDLNDRILKKTYKKNRNTSAVIPQCTQHLNYKIKQTDQRSRNHSLLLQK